MEPIAERTGGRQHNPSHLSTVGGTGCLAPNMESLGGTVRRVGRRGLGMAGGRRGHGQGTLWGDLIGPNPTDRGKAGSKRSLLVEGQGGPLSIVVAGANAHDATLLDETLETIVVERPQLTEDDPQHLCLDKGYVNPSGRRAVARHGYRPHIRRIGEEKLDGSGRKRYPARRWVVERTLAWLSKCRAVLVRYDKKASNYIGLLQLACALLWFRRQWRLAIRLVTNAVTLYHPRPDISMTGTDNCR